MNEFAVLADITCDLSPEIRSRFGVDGYLSGYITTPSGEQISTRLDMSPSELDAFYSSLRSHKHGYKTSAASVPEIAEAFESFVTQGKDVLALSISSRLSATYNLMVQARDSVLEKHARANIVVVDSLKYSAALGLLTIEACRLRERGCSIQETAEKIEGRRSQVHQMGTMDDLFWVASQGRISNAKAFFGTIAGIKTMGDFNNEGMVTPLANVSGFDRAFAAVVEYVKRTITAPEEQIVVVAHSDRRTQAETLATKIRQTVAPKEVLVSEIYPSSGVNIGPGLCAAYYFGREITDLQFEKATINEIVAK